jgi:hypothetical protein
LIGLSRVGLQPLNPSVLVKEPRRRQPECLQDASNGLGGHKEIIANQEEGRRPVEDTLSVFYCKEGCFRYNKVYIKKPFRSKFALYPFRISIFKDVFSLIICKAY